MLQTYNKEVSSNTISVRNYEWRNHLRQAPFLGHWIRYHDPEGECQHSCENENQIPTKSMFHDYSVFCIKDLYTIRHEMNILIDANEHHLIRLHIKKHFSELIYKVKVTRSADEYKSAVRKIDIAPRLFNALNDGKTGTSKVSNIIYQDIEKGTPEVFYKWGMTKQIIKTKRRIVALQQALRPEEGETSDQIEDEFDKLKGLKENSIPYSERRWIINPALDTWTSQEHDDTLITRGMRMLNSLTVSPRTKDAALKMLTGNFVSNLQRAYIDKATPDPYRKCALCGEKNSDYARHYMLQCSTSEKIMELFFKIVQEITVPKCSWFQGSRWRLNSIKRYPSDIERLTFFMDLPPEIRQCGSMLSKQIFTTLLCIQDTINNFRRRGVYRPDQRYLISQVQQQIETQEHICNKSTIFGFTQVLQSNLAPIQIQYNNPSNDINQFMAPLQDIVVQLRVNQIISAVNVHLTESYIQHKHSIRARLYTEREERKYDRLVSIFIHQRYQRNEHRQDCKILDCQICCTNNMLYRAYEGLVDKLKKDNPVMDFTTFSESLLYKRVFKILIQQDHAKYGHSLENLKIFDIVRKF